MKINSRHRRTRSYWASHPDTLKAVLWLNRRVGTLACPPKNGASALEFVNYLHYLIKRSKIINHISSIDDAR